MKNKTFLCTFGEFFCMGCCLADNFHPDRKQLTSAIRNNTLCFKNFGSVKDFANREECGQLRKCGVCNNQIFSRKKVICPLHPGNNGKDLRKREFCSTKFTCETLDEFNEWDEETQKEFLKFVKSKKPDWYQYSINIDNEGYLKEFNKLKE